MNFDLILTNVCKHIELSQKEKTLFTSMLESKKIKRKELHQRSGEVSQHTSFVVDGCLKGFVVDTSGDEHVLSFAFKDWWIGDIDSLKSQKPGLLNIEAIIDSEILMICKSDQDELYKHVPKFERFFRILMENSLVAHQQRLINNLSLPAEERYKIFIQKYPAALLLVPQHSIASYLGITPEFLSKIRSRLAKKGD